MSQPRSFALSRGGSRDRSLDITSTRFRSPISCEGSVTLRGEERRDSSLKTSLTRNRRGATEPTRGHGNLNEYRQRRPLTTPREKTVPIYTQQVGGSSPSAPTRCQNHNALPDERHFSMSDRFGTFCPSFKPCENLREFQLVGGGMSTGTVVNESEPSHRRQARRLKLAI